MTPPGFIRVTGDNGLTIYVRIGAIEAIEDHPGDGVVINCAGGRIDAADPIDDVLLDLEEAGQ